LNVELNFIHMMALHRSAYNPLQNIIINCDKIQRVQFRTEHYTVIQTFVRASN